MASCPVTSSPFSFLLLPPKCLPYPSFLHLPLPASGAGWSSAVQPMGLTELMAGWFRGGPREPIWHPHQCSSAGVAHCVACGLRGTSKCTQDYMQHHAVWCKRWWVAHVRAACCMAEGPAASCNSKSWRALMWTIIDIIVS